jgi:methionyl aminopeptidase
VIIKKSPAEIEKMARAGLILAATLDLMEGKIRPGVSTAELDQVAERYIRSRGAEPTFKGYRGFPGSICASPNGMIVHGIPGTYRLKRGDIISIDVGVTLDGWVADAARTFAVDEVGEQARNLLSATEESLYVGVARARAGNRMGDVSSAIQRVAEGAGLSVVRSLVGHGVGRSMHEDPQVPNYGKPGKGPLLEEGMVLAIEPMTTAGRPAVRVGGDSWAIFSQDGSPAAHFEFTVAITGDGPKILTPWHLAPEDRMAESVPQTQRARVGGERAGTGGPHDSGVATIRGPARTRGDLRA